MARLWLGVLFAIALGALGVARLVARSPEPRGYSGLEFTRVTEAAAARAPLLSTPGALVEDVAADSPAARAGIKPGAVVATIDGVSISSARQASEIVRRHGKGDRVRFVLFDEAKSAIHPKTVELVFDAAPPESKTIFLVDPPRTLAKEHFAPPVMAANAAWSRRLTHGVSVRARAMPRLNAGACSGVAPEKWRVQDFAPALIHLSSADSGLHAIYKLVPLDAAQAQDPQGTVTGLIHAV